MKHKIFSLIIPIFLVGCQLVNPNQNNDDLLNWKYGDLRLLDGIDTTEPDQDLIALYTRSNNQSFQIRLDFLDLDTFSGKDIYILLDTNPGGNQQITTHNNGTIATDINWDYLLIIPDTGNVEILNERLSPILGMELFILHDSQQDRIIISFNKSSLPISSGKTIIQVIITPANQNVISDKSESFYVDAPSPSRGKVLFAFWNTFSSVTPAQTLRSWAGAHAGPMSSRHGLKYIIDASAKSNSTIFLLDLLTPDTLSALDFINALPGIRNLATQGILVIPNISNIEEIITLPDIVETAQPYTMRKSMNYYDIWRINSNLESTYLSKNSDFLLLMKKYIMLNKLFLDVGVYDYAQYMKFNNYCDLLPSFTQSGATNHYSNISLGCKRTLLSYAMSHPTTPLLLGGDFSKSVLGDPNISTEVFSYIRAHPWIQILSISDFSDPRELLYSAPLPHYESTSEGGVNTQQADISGNANFTIAYNKVYDALLKSPRNQLTDLAWRVFTHLTHADSPDLISLQSNYLGQIGYILTAAQWAESPLRQETCSIDLNYDGRNECILANTNIFVIVEPEGGYIPFVFAKDTQGMHQILGPTWEFDVGLSDASLWQPDLGVRGDPGQLLGAFQDPFDNWNVYKVNLLENAVIMYNDEMTMRKSVTISSNSLHFDIQNSSLAPDNSSIPLVLDPWIRYISGWGDLYAKISQPFNIQWGITAGEMVQVRSTNQMNVFSFNDTRASLAYPEDPNYDYSPGHYLPFPMSVVEIIATVNYSAEIIINP